MKRFLPPPDKKLGADFELDGAEFHHLVVTRAQAGDTVVCGVGDIDYLYAVKSISKNSANLRFVCSTPNLCNPRADLTVYLPLIQLDKLSLCIQKLNEIGARQARIVKFDRSNIPSTAVSLEKLNKVALESCKQCNRTVPIEIIKEQTLYPNALNFDKIIFCDERETVTKLGDLDFARGERVALIIGCEGGFTDRERKIIKAMKGTIAVSLGARILRAETAAIAAASIILSRLGEL